MDMITGVETLPAYAPDDIWDEETAPTPPPFANPFQEQKHTWVGTDGSEWDFSDPATGVFLVQEGLEGMHLPVTDDVIRETPNNAGASFHGYRVKARDVVWVLYIYTDDSSDAFYDLDSRVFKSMRLGKYGTWRVTLPDSTFRELRMRQVSTPVAFDRDPGKFGWFKYPMRFIADDQPLWSYPNEVAGSRVTFEDKPGKNFLGGGEPGTSTKGPPMHLTPTRSEASREFHNPGDEDVWPQVDINGPMDSLTFTIGSRTYGMTPQLEAGEWVKINTDPRYFSVLDNDGNDRIKDLNSWIFEPLPWGETTTLSTSIQGLGGGSVIFHVDPLFHRAWG